MATKYTKEQLIEHIAKELSKIENEELLREVFYEVLNDIDQGDQVIHVQLEYDLDTYKIYFNVG